jgi:exodeoxyribonuclease-3
MRLLTWNIRAGGGSRIPAIGSALAPLDADVLVLTEYRDGPSVFALHAELERLGYKWVTRCLPPRGRNGVLIASRRRFQEIGTVSAAVDEPWRMIEVAIGRIRVVGVYMPNLRVKIPYWEALIQVLSESAKASIVTLGDFNICRPFLDEAGATDATARFMDEAQTAGFRDLWRDRNPEGREFSWYSTRGNGFRVDHAFLSPRLVNRATNIRYTHDARVAGISDHSMLVLDLR